MATLWRQAELFENVTIFSDPGYIGTVYQKGVLNTIIA
jgi:hypothetical protein